MAANLAVPMKEYAMGTPWMWPRRSRTVDHSRSEAYTNDSWEERAFAEDTGGGPMGEGSIWPPRSYSCTFCRREFRSAQALGGHMNVHRRDRALLRQSSSLSGINYPPESDSDLNFSSNSAVGNGSDHHQSPPCSYHPDHSSNNSFLYCNNPATIVSIDHPSPYPPPVMFLYSKSDAFGTPSDDRDRHGGLRPGILSPHPPSAGLLSISSCNPPPMHFAPSFRSRANVSDSALTVNAVDISKESSDSTWGVVSEVEGSSIVTDSLFKDNKEGTLKKLRIGAALHSRKYDHDENVSDATRRIRICREKKEMHRLDAMEDSTDDDLDLELRLGERPPQAHPK